MSDTTCIANEIRALAMRLSTLLDTEDAGFRKAEDIADYWHARFLTMRDDHPAGRVVGYPMRDALQHKAEGAKQVLDEIRAERKRLAAPAPVDEERK